MNVTDYVPKVASFLGCFLARQFANLQGYGLVTDVSVINIADILLECLCKTTFHQASQYLLGKLFCLQTCIYVDVSALYVTTTIFSRKLLLLSNVPTIFLDLIFNSVSIASRINFLYLMLQYEAICFTVFFNSITFPLGPFFQTSLLLSC